MSNLSTGPGPQNAPEPSHGQPDTAGLNGTTRSGDQAPAPLDRAPWLFQKGNTYGQMRKHHKGRMEKYIQEQTKDGARIVDRKSTRLNSSHRCISYAVFCLKKKKRPLFPGPL